MLRGRKLEVRIVVRLSVVAMLGKAFEAAASRREAIDRLTSLALPEDTVEANDFYFGMWIQFEPI